MFTTHLNNLLHAVHTDHPLIGARQIARAVSHASGPKRFAFSPRPLRDKATFVNRRRYERFLRVALEGSCPVKKGCSRKRRWYDAWRQEAGEFMCGNGGGMRAFVPRGHFCSWQDCR